MAKVHLSNITKTFRNPAGAEMTGLQNVTFEVGDHEFVVLAGPRGSGKTTLLRMIAGLEEVSSGEISIGEKRVEGLSPKERDVAMVFGEDALYPHISVFDNVAFGLRRRKFAESEIQRRVNDAAALLDLNGVLEQKPNALSLEHRQRVGWARAVVRQPQVLMFDDPLATLDATTRVQMRGELARLHQRLETTVIYATGDPLEALTLADRIVAMDRGVVQQIDTIQGIYDAPANLFVAGYFGAPTMNLLHGTLKQERDSIAFRESDDGTLEARFAAAEAGRIREFVGKPVILGIRPEDLRIVPRPTSGEKPTEGIAAMLELVEPLGPVSHLHLHTGAHRLICRAPTFVHRAEAGHRVRFVMDLAKAHLFDPLTSNRLH